MREVSSDDSILDEFNIFIKMLDGTTKTLSVRGTDTVEEVWEKFEAKFGASSSSGGAAKDTMQFMFAGERLEEMGSKLINIGVAKDSHLEVVMRLRGGGRHKFGVTKMKVSRGHEAQDKEWSFWKQVALIEANAGEVEAAERTMKMGSDIGHRAKFQGIMRERELGSHTETFFFKAKQDDESTFSYLAEGAKKKEGKKKGKKEKESDPAAASSSSGPAAREEEAPPRPKARFASDPEHKMMPPPQESGPAATQSGPAADPEEDTYQKLREILSSDTSRRKKAVLMAAHIVQLGFTQEEMQVEEEVWMQTFQKDPRRARWDYGIEHWWASGGPSLRDRLLKLLMWLSGRVQWMDKNPDTDLSDYEEYSTDGSDEEEESDSVAAPPPQEEEESGPAAAPPPDKNEVVFNYSSIGKRLTWEHTFADGAVLTGPMRKVPGKAGYTKIYTLETDFTKVDVYEDATVADVKKKLAKKLNLKHYDFVLQANGKTLHVDTKVEKIRREVLSVKITSGSAALPPSDPVASSSSGPAGSSSDPVALQISINCKMPDGTDLNLTNLPTNYKLQDLKREIKAKTGWHKSLMNLFKNDTELNDPVATLAGMIV
jgi:hypothetical protein